MAVFRTFLCGAAALALAALLMIAPQGGLGIAKADDSAAIAESGRALLMKFFDKDADHAALTAALKPTAEDIRAVYAAPLADTLVAMYEELFAPGAAIEPSPEHSELLTVFTTTAKLKAGDAALDDFPGGYRKLLPHMVGDVPIGRFKFVEAGETLGLAFDGLIYVNDRWVLMPKPWRGLK